MPYDYNRAPSRRKSLFTNKWTKYPKDVLPMWLADMDLPTAPAIIKALHEQVEHGVLGYEMVSLTLFEAIAARMQKLYNWKVNPEHIIYTAGVNNGYNVAVRFLCSAEKGYLIQTPVYNEFQEAEMKTGSPQRVNRLVKKVEAKRIRYEIDFDDFEREVQRAGMFLLCNPHNPIGQIHSRADLARMAEICLKHNVVIVSDEIHSEIILDGKSFTPISTLAPQVEARTITLISASKAFNMPGLSCAFAIVPDETLRKQFTKIADGMSVETSTLGLTATYVAYTGKADTWLRGMNRHLKSNRDLILDYVDKNLPGIQVTKPEATYLAWLDCTSLNLKPSPYEFFLQEAKLALSDGKKFGDGSEQFVRLNFGTSRPILMQGLKRMSNALKTLK